jgi:PHD/YefM family antitoxin component YafN of YafNO toxin-antitoxin module
MTTVPAAVFARNLGLYQREVHKGPIEVTSHGHVTGYFISPEEFQRYTRLLAASRRAYHPRELPDYLKHAVSETRMDPEHDHLNALVDDEPDDPR